MTANRIEVSRNIAAEPAVIFEILRSPDGHVQIDASGMLMWAEGEPATAAGDRFRMHMDRDALRDFDIGEYELDVVFTRVESDRAIEWGVESPLFDPPIGHVYGYELEPIDGGTRVTQYYDWSNLHPNYQDTLGASFPIVPERALLGTLGILARTVAPGKSRPGA
ncbi:MAG: hypothetical protein R8F63_06455 [Acidimicrobiales bacterium]|nr:hypothetical protein [Acidimicrobiales bacterium]